MNRREPEFIGDEIDCGVNDSTNGAEVPLNKEQIQLEKLLQIMWKK